MRFLATERDLEGDTLAGTLATLPHMAYHLETLGQLVTGVYMEVRGDPPFTRCCRQESR